LLLRIRSEDASNIGDALSDLESRGLAYKRAVQHEGGGRPAEAWYPGTDEDPEPDDGKVSQTSQTMFVIEPEPDGVNSFLPVPAGVPVAESEGSKTPTLLSTNPAPMTTMTMGEIFDNIRSYAVVNAR